MRDTVNVEDLKREFCAAGEQLVFAKGSQALTIRAIVNMTHRSNASFYLCYADKEELLDDIYIKFTQDTIDQQLKEVEQTEELSDAIRVFCDKVADDIANKNREFVKDYLITQITTMNEQHVLSRALAHLIAERREQLVQDTSVQDIAFYLAQNVYVELLNSYRHKDSDIHLSNQRMQLYMAVLHEYLHSKSAQRKAGVSSKTERMSEAGIDIAEGINRFSGNRDSYMQFLKEFFYDEDFKNLKDALERKDVQDAFEYAHGLKGLAGTLSVHSVYERLVVLVEILRKQSLEGADEAYKEVISECDRVRAIVEEETA